jgi:hypothetical protein
MLLLYSFLLVFKRQNKIMFHSRSVSLILLATIAVTSPTIASAQGSVRKVRLSADASNKKLQSKSRTEHNESPSSSSPDDNSHSKGLFETIFGSRNSSEDTNRQLSTSMHYNQMGTDLNGQSADDGIGQTTAISKDGLRMAVSCPTAAAGKGATMVRDWDAVLGQWTQVGQMIMGNIPNMGLGYSLDMNEDGSKIILGAPEAHSDDGIVYVYELVGNVWQVVGGAPIAPDESDGQAGVSVTMSATGDRVAVGAPRTNAYNGRVSVYELDESGQWARVGQHLDSSEFMAYSGGSISMDASGNRLVIGARLGGYYMGYVKVYDYDTPSSQWVQIGYINGEDYYDRFGSDVDISEDGTRIVVGAFTSDGQAAQIHDAGEFSVFKYDASSSGGWSLLGQQVVGDATMDKLGDSVAISGDGSHVAISSPGNDGVWENAGKVVVYKYSAAEDAWVKEGSDIHGECPGDSFGEGGGAVALDRTGSHLAVGSQRGGYYTGMTRVYELLTGPGDGTNGSINECN